MKKLLVVATFVGMLLSFGLFSDHALAASVTVKKGDTLYKISTQKKVSVANLKKWNQLSSSVIHVGQVLQLQAPGTTTPAPSTGTYKVKKGDTLSEISALYKTTVATLKKLNNLTSDTIRIGQVLKVPGNVKEVTPKPTTPKPTATYTVKKGDILSKIASKYNTTVKNLKALNGLKSDLIRIGQALKVAGTPVKQSPFIRPAEGTLTSGFGTRKDPHTGKTAGHFGVDIAKSGKTVAVKAAASGTVSKSYVSGSYGEVVFVLHKLDGKEYETVYAHLSKDSRTVKEGAKVTQGQRLGYMGATGEATGQHLHFEIHQGKWNSDKSNAIDPWLYIPK